MGKSYILSLSYGKDSLACLGAIEQLKMPLDRIIHSEVWATDTIPAELPEMIEFKQEADKIILEKWGIAVEHIRHPKTYEQMFYTVRARGNYIGNIYGFPITQKAKSWCKQLKITGELDNLKDNIIYVGLTVDEPNRFHNLNENKISPLKEIGWTEKDCYKWCKENNLLSPVYENSFRSGCWFCHCQSQDQLRRLRKNYPDYWDLLMKWDLDSPTTFCSNGVTIHDYDRRFQLEDLDLIPRDKKFRWNMLEMSAEELKELDYNKKVICVETGEEFKNIFEVQQITGIYSDNVKKNLMGKTENCGGYHWRYKED